MGAFILILYITSISNSTGMAITSHRFTSQLACEMAGKMSEAKFSQGDIPKNVRFVCAPEFIKDK
jgi:hypothetical protein